MLHFKPLERKNINEFSTLMCKLPPVEKSGAALDISTRDIFPKILKLAEQYDRADEIEKVQM